MDPKPFSLSPDLSQGLSLTVSSFTASTENHPLSSTELSSSPEELGMRNPELKQEAGAMLLLPWTRWPTSVDVAISAPRKYEQGGSHQLVSSTAPGILWLLPWQPNKPQQPPAQSGPHVQLFHSFSKNHRKKGFCWKGP